MLGSLQYCVWIGDGILGVFWPMFEIRALSSTTSTVRQSSGMPPVAEESLAEAQAMLDKVALGQTGIAPAQLCLFRAN